MKRTINVLGSSGPAFQFKWNLSPQLGNSPTDSSIGYRIDIVSKRPGNGQVVNGDIVYVSHNTYIQTGMYNYEGTKVRSLGGGDDAVITWQVTIVKAAGGFDDQGHEIGPEISCGPASVPSTIQLVFQ